MWQSEKVSLNDLGDGGDLATEHGLLGSTDVILDEAVREYQAV